MRRELLATLDTKIQSTFVTNTKRKYLCLDPDTLMFFIKERKNKASLFLLPYLLL
jgi:hypothetical protein